MQTTRCSHNVSFIDLFGFRFYPNKLTKNKRPIFDLNQKIRMNEYHISDHCALARKDGSWVHHSNGQSNPSRVQMPSSAYPLQGGDWIMTMQQMLSPLMLAMFSLQTLVGSEFD